MVVDGDWPIGPLKLPVSFADDVDQPVAMLMVLTTDVSLLRTSAIELAAVVGGVLPPVAIPDEVCPLEALLITTMMVVPFEMIVVLGIETPPVAFTVDVCSLEALLSTSIIVVAFDAIVDVRTAGLESGEIPPEPIAEEVVLVEAFTIVVTYVVPFSVLVSGVLMPPVAFPPLVEPLKIMVLAITMVLAYVEV